MYLGSGLNESRAPVANRSVRVITPMYSSAFAGAGLTCYFTIVAALSGYAPCHCVDRVVPYLALHQLALNSVWWYNIDHMILAILLATATTALCLPRRSINCLAQRDMRSSLWSTLRMTDQAPCTSNRRR